MKMKIGLLAIVFTLSTFTVSHASVLSTISVGEFSLLQYLLEDKKLKLEDTDSTKESEGGKEIDSPMDSDLEPATYEVTTGDNLYRIAVNHQISLESLKGWNDLTGDVIHPGNVLIVSGDEEDVNVVTPESEKKMAVQKPKPPTPNPPGNGKEMTVTATAYTAYCPGCSGTTAYGIDLRSNPNQKVIAVDPRIIPLGTRVWVENYGEAIAGDTGGAIKGNKIDVFIPSHASAMQWGVQKVKLRVLN